MGGWEINFAPWLLYPWKRDPVHIAQEAGWAPGQEGLISPPPEFNPWTIQPTASHYRHKHWIDIPNEMLKW